MRVLGKLWLMIVVMALKELLLSSQIWESLVNVYRLPSGTKLSEAW